MQLTRNVERWRSFLLFPIHVLADIDEYCSELEQH